MCVGLGCGGFFFPCDSLKRKRTASYWMSSEKWLRVSLEWAEKRENEEVKILQVFYRGVASNFWLMKGHIIHQ